MSRLPLSLTSSLSFLGFINPSVAAQSGLAPVSSQTDAVGFAHLHGPLDEANKGGGVTKRRGRITARAALRSIALFCLITLFSLGARAQLTLNFGPDVAYASGGGGPSSLAVGDVNGDGKLDVVVANQCASPDGPCVGDVGVLLGNGDGTFQKAVDYPTGGSNANSVALADVNGDGKLDIVVANCASSGLCPSTSDGVVAVLLGNGDGTFQSAVIYDSGGPAGLDEPEAVAIADVNGDGKPDLLVLNAPSCPPACGDSNVGVLLGNGDGTFQPAMLADAGASFGEALTVADVNKDGKPDLLVARYDGSVAVLLGNGDGTFQPPALYSSGPGAAWDIAVADMNKDGNPDLLVVNLGIPGNGLPGGVGVLLGNGDGTFRQAQGYPAGGLGGIWLAVGDFNQDGNLDVVVTAQCTDGIECLNSTFDVLLGNGDGSLQALVSFPPSYYPGQVAVADVNGDGKPDVLIATPGQLHMRLNTGLEMTTTTLTSSSNPSQYGQAITFTAVVKPQSASHKGIPTGTVTFLDGGANIGNATLNGSGIATLTTSTLAISTHNITVTYNGDATFAASTSSVLSQVVQGAIAQLSLTSLAFGNQTVGVASAPQSVTLSNTGNIALTLSIGITGANFADYGQTNTCGTSVAAGGSCTITVTFTPTATGTRIAAVSISDNASGSPQSVSLRGAGVLPAVTFSTGSLTFPTQVVFTNSKAQNVTLTNNGLGILEIKGGGVSSQYGLATNCGKTVAPGASCTLSVTFKPTTKGTVAGAVSINDNAPMSPQKIQLTGTGTYVQLTPLSVNFGNQPVGTTSLTKRITLSNKGSVAVSISGITITGTNAGDFAETNNCGTSVGAGASCFIGVTFTPSATGARSASVSVSDNGGGSPQTVNLTGTGT